MLSYQLIVKVLLHCSYDYEHTENRQHRAVLQDFHGTWAHKVDRLQGISLPEEVFPRSTEGGFDMQRQRPEATAAGTLEKGELQNLLVQVHGDVWTQLVWEVF